VSLRLGVFNSFKGFEERAEPDGAGDPGTPYLIRDPGTPYLIMCEIGNQALSLDC
jgi:hypothetical protein